MRLNYTFTPTIKVPSGFYLIVDTREQKPLFDKEPWVIHKALPQGDYSILGFEDRIAIERKALDDLLSCLGIQRDRFLKEVKRLENYEWKGLVIECSERDLYIPSRFSSFNLQSLYGSICSLEARGFHIYYAPTREYARAWVLSRLTRLFKHRRLK